MVYQRVHFQVLCYFLPPCVDDVDITMFADDTNVMKAIIP